MEVKTISPQELKQVLDRDPGALLIDVRSPGEFESAHIPQAENYPLDSSKLNSLLENQKGAKNQVYLTCQSGNRSRTAAEKFVKAGIPASSLEGGTSKWRSAGLPVTEGEQRMSLERQVRIAAGSFVVLGIALFYAGFPSFILLSVFVGLGLIFSGITDTCGMARILAFMPWNRAGSGNSSGKACCSIK